MASSTSHLNLSHTGADVAVLEKRKEVYEPAKARNPNGWGGATRNWERVNEVWLNPERSNDDNAQTTRNAA